MEKFYIVTNEEFLDRVKKVKIAESERRKLIHRFFDEKGIDGKVYYIGGSGYVGVPFTERFKRDINLGINNTENNVKLFDNQLKKDTVNGNMRMFKKSSKILKAFQDECIKEQIVINNHEVRVGDYFEELELLGYTYLKFEYDGKYYLYISSNKVESITPKKDGFNEIKGSEFYKVKELLESK